MEQELAISLSNVSKCFKRYDRPLDRLKETLLPSKSYADNFWALSDINLDIPKGQTVGIVGRNGSGKSTLLQIIAGTLTATTGEVHVKGRVSALLELGCGFNPEFTGRQNVFFNGRLLGLNQTEIEDKFDEIAGFADIGDFIDRPVKTYSSGMFVRLAFAVAVNVNPEILIVDEALAVGDFIFQHRCMRRMRELMDSGVTTLFVSHDAGAIKSLCNSAVMIHDGKICASGLPNPVIIEYLKLVTDLELSGQQVDVHGKLQEPIGKAKTVENTETTSNICIAASLAASDGNFGKSTRRGSGKAKIEAIKFINQSGDDAGEHPTFMFNEEVTLIVNVRAYETLQGCIVGFHVCDKNGNEIIGSNTFEENIRIEYLQVGEQIRIQFQFKLPLRPNSYSLTVAGAQNYQDVTFDWIDNAVIFQVLPPATGKNIYALVAQPIDVKVERQSLNKKVLSI
jgi:lipopolysaccharide transport system ATP-binding protein